MSPKKAIIILLLLAMVIIGIFFYFYRKQINEIDQSVINNDINIISSSSVEQIDNSATSTMLKKIKQEAALDAAKQTQIIERLNNLQTEKPKASSSVRDKQQYEQKKNEAKDKLLELIK